MLAYKSPLVLSLITGMFCSVPGQAQFTQQGNKLIGYDVSLAANLGASVALSADGNTAIVGGPGDANPSSGAAWIFTRSGVAWAQQGGKLVPNDGGGVGHSVALSADGNTALIGGPGDNNETGAAWVFTRTGGVWTQQGNKLVGTGGAPKSWLGTSVALSADGKTALIGGPQDNAFAGAVWVFTLNGSAWSQQGAKLVPNDAAGRTFFGGSVALSADGNTALIGGGFDHNGVGATWAFTRNGSVWSQQGSRLVPGDPTGEPSFGGSVALSTDGNTALVGGAADNNGVGATWVFTRIGSAWTQQGPKLVASGNIGPAFQGSAVAVAGDGNTAVVGGPGDGNCDATIGCEGATWVFRRINGVWTQQAKLFGTGQSGLLPAQGSAVAVSADGSTAFVGGPNGQQEEFLGGYFVGAAWAYALPHFTITAPSSANSGTPIFFLISVRDANDLLLPSYPGVLHFTSSDSAAVLPGDATMFTGVRGFSGTLEAAGSQTLTATDTANSGIFGSAAISVAASGTNLAFGKTATQSSTFPGYPTAGAAAAIDGNLDGSFFDGSVTATNLDPNPWWQVDLGASASVSSIVIWNRMDCCGSRLDDYWVFISDTPFGPSDIPTTLQGRAGTFSSHQIAAPNPSTTIAAGAQGRYVRVQLTGANYLSLAEVQVFGQ